MLETGDLIVFTCPVQHLLCLGEQVVLHDLLGKDVHQLVVVDAIGTTVYSGVLVEPESFLEAHFDTVKDVPTIVQQRLTFLDSQGSTILAPLGSMSWVTAEERRGMTIKKYICSILELRMRHWTNNSIKLCQ